MPEIGLFGSEEGELTRDALPFRRQAVPACSGAQLKRSKARRLTYRRQAVRLVLARSRRGVRRDALLTVGKPSRLALARS